MYKRKLFTILMLLGLAFFLYSCVDADKFTIHFDSNGGSEVLSITTDGIMMLMPDPPTKEGYIFVGWFLEDETFDTLFTGNTLKDDPLIGDITLYAKWDPIINVYSITYELNGGMNELTNPTTFNSNTSSLVIYEAAKIGNTFDGWYLDSEFSELFNPSSLPTDDLTLYAKWIVNIYTIEYWDNGGILLQTLSYEYGASLDDVVAPIVTMEGYDFVGWNQDLPPTMPTRDLRITPLYVINQYTISFNSNGGAAIDEMTQDFGTEVTAPTNPTKEGFVFGGWYLDQLLTTAYTFTTMPAENITLYAKWISGDSVYLDHLVVAFYPSRDTETMIQGIPYLPELLKAEMEKSGYFIENVSVYMGDSYESVGADLIAGTADIAFLPGNLYAMYSTGGLIDAILASTRIGLNKDFSDAKDWNDGLETTSDPLSFVPYYRSLGIVGQTVKGRALAEIINGGGAITWADLQDVKIGVQSVTSAGGRVYPSLLFSDLYGHTLEDLPYANIIQVAGYGGAVSAIASGDVDLAFVYADARRDYADRWISNDVGGYGHTLTIWQETDVVFVTDGIYNDAVAISTATAQDEILTAAMQQAFINMAQDSTALDNPSGVFNTVKDIFLVYNHEGYVIVDDAAYDQARAALLLYNN